MVQSILKNTKHYPNSIVFDGRTKFTIYVTALSTCKNFQLICTAKIEKFKNEDVGAIRSPTIAIGLY